VKAPYRRSSAGAVVAAAALLLASAAATAGNLTSAAELSAVRVAADGGVAPHVYDREQLMTDARRSWRWGSVSGEFVTTESGGTKSCHPSGNPTGSDYLVDGAPDVYAKAIGSHLTGDESLAREARGRVLDLLDTHGFHGLSGDFSGSNQCILELAISMPIWIETAMLLEESPVWQAADGIAFRSWLAAQVYPKVAWASRIRRNNWGTAGSAAAYVIARYVEGKVATLRELAPNVVETSPAAAAAAHVAMQRERIGRSWVGDSRCSALGIQWHGGIPEELRRGSTGCDGTSLADDDRSQTYQTMHVQLLVLHAEAMRAHGDDSLYEALLPEGVPAILQSIRFVIANPAGGRSFGWPDSRQGALNVAATWYEDAAVNDQARHASTFRGGATLPYTRLTHSGIATPPEAHDTTLGVPGKPLLVR
jgi:hypothetical protein